MSPLFATGRRIPASERPISRNLPKGTCDMGWFTRGNNSASLATIWDRADDVRSGFRTALISRPRALETNRAWSVIALDTG